MFERATRECAMSPTITTSSPSLFPLWRRIVAASSSACVGCSCWPSPALIIATAGRTLPLITSAAPPYL